MRLLSAAAKGHSARAALLAAWARSMPGVIGASANPLTGSLIIRYDVLPQRRAKLLRALRAEGPAPAEPGAEDTPVWFGAIIDLLVECLLRAAIVAMI